MHRFFFDCFDGERHIVDGHGLLLESESEARDHAISVAQSLSVEVLPSGDGRDVAVTARADDGSAVYIARCTFTGRWTKGREPAAAPKSGA